ncbi:MAG TPA: hypothetical protein VG649_04540 [Candidatus Angelobacter sp.]|jgi:hypothetical protein|nr:hypothetical protein [Candidatus Angelobacter sp.]
MAIVERANSNNNHVLIEDRQDEHRKESVDAVIKDFCKDLSANDSHVVSSEIVEISGLKQQMVSNMLGIGECLGNVRRIVGLKKFNRFMSDVLPALGISRSTGYRWLGFAEGLAPLFPNPLLRKHLMVLTDGKGIVTYSERHGKRDSSEIVLTAAAQAALASLPPLQKNTRNSAECAEWARQFIKAMNKARSRSRTRGLLMAQDQETVIRLFKRFADRHGWEAAEELCGRLDKELDKMVTRTAVSGSQFRAAIPGSQS